MVSWEIVFVLLNFFDSLESVDDTHKIRILIKITFYRKSVIFVFVCLCYMAESIL